MRHWFYDGVCNSAVGAAQSLHSSEYNTAIKTALELINKQPPDERSIYLDQLIRALADPEFIAHIPPGWKDMSESEAIDIRNAIKVLDVLDKGSVMRLWERASAHFPDSIR